MEVDDQDIEVPFDDTFDLFKIGVAKQVDVEDFETHYNLGIAYKEMGLLDDAEREFTIAQATPRLQITSFMMVGLCQLQRGNTHGAIEQFMKGLAAPHISSQEQVALRYEVAAAYEQMGRPADALKFYEHACTMDGHFRDVAHKVAELTTQSKSSEDVASAELDILLGAALPTPTQMKPGH
jgi:pilus assembly protein FimV